MAECVTLERAAARRLTPLGTQSRAGSARMRLAKGRTAAVRGVPEDAPHAGAVPPVFAGAGRHLPRTQAPCDLAEARALLAYPGEDLLHHLRLLGDDLVARLAAALPAADVAVAVGRPAEHVDATALRPMALAPTAALEDLGPLVLGDHALDLQQELLLGIVPHGMVEEDDLDPGAAKLVDQQHLIGVLARQAIGRVDIEALDRPRAIASRSRSNAGRISVAPL